MSHNDNNRNKLKPAWRRFALRAQNIQRKKENAAIVQMTVLINLDGNPVMWTEPKVILLEPRLGFDITSLNEQLSPEEMQALLQVVAES